MSAPGGLTPGMPRIKQPSEFEIVVDGETYVWRFHRRPQWSGPAAEWRGKVVVVRHRDGQREAMLEFPPGPPPRHGAPQPQASLIAPELVAKAIASAIAAGWDPQSRGKTVAIVVDEHGG